MLTRGRVPGLAAARGALWAEVLKLATEDWPVRETAVHLQVPTVRQADQLRDQGALRHRYDIAARSAVPIRRSVQQDYVVCLECGFRAQALRRHLRAAHGLEVAQYRARWNLPADHPVTAPAYSNRRSVMAKAIGLGRRRASVTAPSAPPRRRRPRSLPTT